MILCEIKFYMEGITDLFIYLGDGILIEDFSPMGIISNDKILILYNKKYWPWLSL